MSDPYPDDWLDSDMLDVLALPLNRVRMALGGDPADQDDHVYSNGTEHDFALEYAEAVLERGPVLRAVLRAGLLTLGSHIGAPFGCRDAEAILALEAKYRMTDHVRLEQGDE